MKTFSVENLARGGIIAALYVVLTYIFAPISFGPIQVRIAEMLTILPLFTSTAIPGLFLGCLLANILGGAILPDIIFGSLATLIGAVGTWAIGKATAPDSKLRYLAPLPPIAANTFIIPFVLYYGYGVNLPIPLQMLTVGLGEIISCGILGCILMTVLTRYGDKIFLPES